MDTIGGQEAMASKTMLPAGLKIAGIDVSGGEAGKLLHNVIFDASLTGKIIVNGEVVDINSATGKLELLKVQQALNPTSKSGETITKISKLQQELSSGQYSVSSESKATTEQPFKKGKFRGPYWAKSKSG